MQNQENESLYDKFRGKAKISDSISSLLSLSESSDKGSDLSNSHDYSGPSWIYYVFIMITIIS